MTGHRVSPVWLHDWQEPGTWVLWAGKDPVPRSGGSYREFGSDGPDYDLEGFLCHRENMLEAHGGLYRMSWKAIGSVKLAWIKQWSLLLFTSLGDLPTAAVIKSFEG